MGGDDYYTMGVVEKPSDSIMKGDKGRVSVTHAEADEFAFKSPSLRNIDLTAPYFHSGAVYSLLEAIEVMNVSQLGSKMSKEDMSKVEAFLKSATGKQPKVVYPILPAPTDATLKPALD
jgi:cytochrome c peroxidase